MGSSLVVEVAESIKLTLELGEGGGRSLLAQPLLQGLVEPPNFSLRLGVARMAVSLVHA